MVCQVAKESHQRRSLMKNAGCTPGKERFKKANETNDQNEEFPAANKEAPEIVEERT